MDLAITFLFTMSAFNTETTEDNIFSDLSAFAPTNQQNQVSLRADSAYCSPQGPAVSLHTVSDIPAEDIGPSSLLNTVMGLYFAHSTSAVTFRHVRTVGQYFENFLIYLSAKKQNKYWQN